MWKDLTISQKGEIIKMSLQNGIKGLDEIKRFYDETAHKFDDGGDKNSMYEDYNPKLFLFSEQNNSFSNAGQQVASIENSAVKIEKYSDPSNHYNNTISEQEANLRGFFQDARGHRDDRVKKENHPTHPSRGQFNSLYEYQLSDKGMEDPNYTLFGVVDGNQDPQTILTYNNSIVLPEITITPKGGYIDNTYDNVKYYIGNYVQTK